MLYSVTGSLLYYYYITAYYHKQLSFTAIKVHHSVKFQPVSIKPGSLCDSPAACTFYALGRASCSSIACRGAGVLRTSLWLCDSCRPSETVPGQAAVRAERPSHARLHSPSARRRDYVHQPLLRNIHWLRVPIHAPCVELLVVTRALGNLDIVFDLS